MPSTTLPQAEAKSNANSKALQHNEATQFVVAGDLLPGARGAIGINNGPGISGGPPGVNVAAFGTVALAVTDTGYAAFSGSNAMAAHPDSSAAEHSHGSTTAVWDVGREPLRKGTGKMNDVYTSR